MIVEHQDTERESSYEVAAMHGSNEIDEIVVQPSSKWVWKILVPILVGVSVSLIAFILKPEATHLQADIIRSSIAIEASVWSRSQAKTLDDLWRGEHTERLVICLKNEGSLHCEEDLVVMVRPLCDLVISDAKVYNGIVREGRLYREEKFLEPKTLGNGCLQVNVRGGIGANEELFLLIPFVSHYRKHVVSAEISLYYKGDRIKPMMPGTSPEYGKVAGFADWAGTKQINGGCYWPPEQPDQKTLKGYYGWKVDYDVLGMPGLTATWGWITTETSE